MNYKNFIIIAGFIGISIAATQGLSAPLALSESVKIALKENNNLQAATLNIDAAKGKLLQAGKWPNPELDGGIAKSDLSRSRFEASFLQAFPLGGRIRKQKEVARVDVASAQLEVADYKIGLVAEVKNRFLNGLYNLELITLHQKLKAIKTSILEYVKIRIENGSATAFDLAVAEKDLFATESTLTTLQGNFESSALSLLPLLGSNADATELAGNLRTEIAKLESIRDLSLETVLGRRPDYKLLEINVDRLEQEKALAKAEVFGDVRAGIFVEQEKGGRESDETFVGFKFSIPLPFWNRNEGKILEKKAQIAKGLKNLANKKLEIKSELKIAQNNRARTKTLCAKYQDQLIQKTEVAHKFAMTEYQSGAAPIDRLMQANEALASAHTMYLDCLKSYGEALTAQEKTQGTYVGSK